MRTCARAIVIRNNQLLVMKRFKMGKEYYTLLGGTVEPGETPDQTALREVKEESTLSVSDPRLVFIEDAGDPYGTQYVYLCKYVSGEPVLPPDAEEVYWSSEGKNTYEPMWITLGDLKKVEFVSDMLRQAILMAVEHGWPAEVYRFSPKNAARLN